MNTTLKDLLDAGVHFGHQLRRWNPKSKPYVYANRNGMSIIDLEKTYDSLQKACDFAQGLVAAGKDILFVGTKRQAQETIREAATLVNMPFCANRWLGGTLTNFETIKRSLDKYKKFLAMETEGILAKMPKKEASAIRREMSRMFRNFEGIQDLKGHPAAIFVIDSHNEQIAVAEAIRLEIPVIALVDTNSDPSVISYPIPGNDDAVKSIRIIVEAVVEAIQAGQAQRKIPVADDEVDTNNLSPEVEGEVTLAVDINVSNDNEKSGSSAWSDPTAASPTGATEVERPTVAKERD